MSADPQSTRSRRRRWMALLFLCALGLRCGAIWVAGPSRLEFGDAQFFLEASRSLCTQGEYPALGERTFFRAPGYPLFVCLVTACHPDTLLLVQFGNALVDSLTVVLIWILAGQLIPSRTGQLVAGTVAALHPIFAFQTTDFRSEPLFMALVTGAIVSILAAREGRLRCLPLAGALLGLAALTRPAALVAIPFFAIAWVLGAPAGRRRPAVGGAILLVAAAALVVGGWSRFISVRHGELILVNDAAGYNLWRGTHPELIAALESPDRQTYEERTRHFESVTSPAEVVAVAREADSPMGRDRAWRRRAHARIAADPLRFLGALGGNLWRFWRPWLNPLEYPQAVVLASGALLLPILILGGIGLAGLRAREPWLLGFIVAWFLLVSLAHVPFQAVMRFRLPFTDPILIGAMSGGLEAIRRRLSIAVQGRAAAAEGLDA